MNKKILIVTECFYPEEFKINEVALVWKQKGYDVDVLTTVPTYPESEIYKGYTNKFYQKDSYNGINIYRVKAVTGYKTSLFKKLLKYFSFMFFASFVALFIGKKYDYIFGFNMSALTGMVPAILIKKIYKKRLIFWVQDVWPESVYAYGFKKTKFLSFCLDKFVEFMYHNIDAIAISSKGFKEKLKPYIKENLEFYYLPNWADELDMSQEAAKFSQEKKIHFTFAGNVGKVQNLENIIMAFNTLEDKYQEKAQLNIVGNGSSLNDLINLNKKDNVVFYGRKPRNEMAKYYKASDFLIVSLLNKPIFTVTVPAKTQTYIAANKPILGIINGDGADIIRENNLG
ncbi:MAG: glycosyltransferase family 4 protein, partial [Epsilonproteobacteria bacterium]|nr:glycosyltransferase family 4 protein [Campylobacterota bacterium]